MMDPSSSSLGTSFDPSRLDPGPQGSSPSQALQVIGLHLPKMFGARSVAAPGMYNTGRSHVGQTPEALVLNTLLDASRRAGTLGANGVTGGPESQPQGDVQDLFRLISQSMMGESAPAQAPTPPQPQAPQAPTQRPTPSYGTPTIRSSDNFQTTPGFMPSPGVPVGQVGRITPQRS